MKAKSSTRVIRRSVALPPELVQEVEAVAPSNLKGNFNRLVSVALQRFARQRKAEAFEEAMGRMAADPSIRAECAAISKEFLTTESDGLKND
ncbi:MAG: hypothetical protein FJ117_08045 [Deltaproteobacteria bacterium]|nr:hypothetical protein [Deltaproteobacteria bacterium]